MKETSGAASVIKGLLEPLATGNTPSPRLPDRIRLMQSMTAIVQGNDLRLIDEMLGAVEGLAGGVVLARRELWQEMRKVLREHDPTLGRSLAETAWRHRDTARRIGRRAGHRCLATTLLVKGLEFDHALILDAGDLPDAENLYVAMTRGVRSLTILSGTPILQRQRPRYLSK
jgi:DNA helicase-2/ATP-dependent DNA helicase PcrA